MGLWKILVYAILIVVIKKESTYFKELVKRANKILFARVEECCNVHERIRLIPQTDGALNSPGEEASPLNHRLNLAAFSKYPNRFTSLFEDTVDLLQKEQKSEPPKLSFHGIMMAGLQGQTKPLEDALKSCHSLVTDAKNILKASQKNAEQFQREIMDGLDKNTNFQEGL